jgi:PIN domain nuclease of toxin-antitoxin system
MNQAKKNKIEVLPIGLNHILKVSALPLIHRDPFDRMLVAQALSEPLLLLTADKTVASYSSLIKLVIK